MSYLRGRRTESGYGVVTLNGSGAGTLAVTFAEAFTAAPHVTVVPHAGDTATPTAASVTKAGFTLTVTGSAMLSQDAEFTWAAFEKS